ncbi:MAG: YceI family protein [Flavobacteriales bacterium]|nr:MAG: YceI family protein [Flavobacteriales bacterium]
MHALILMLSVTMLLAFTLDGSSLVVEPNHSTIAFTVPISNGLTTITGKFTDFTIDLELPDDDLTHARIRAVIQTASVNTGIPSRDADLLTADFFETEKYPTITFTSDSITGAEPGYTAHGRFTMHGVERSMALPFRVTGRDGESTIGFEAHTHVLRSDHGVGITFKHTEDDGFIGNLIGVDIWFWTKAKKSVTRNANE